MSRHPHPYDPVALADLLARRPDLATLPLLMAAVATMLGESA